MKIYHTSPNKIEKIEKNGLFDDNLFFSRVPYSMSNSNGDETLYLIDIEEDSVIDVTQFFYDYDIEENDEFRNIVETISNYFTCAIDDACEILDSSKNIDDAEDDWFVQAQQGHAARALGFNAAKSIDEQGVVYIVPMFGKEKELKIVDNY